MKLKFEMNNWWYCTLNLAKDVTFEVSESQITLDYRFSNALKPSKKTVFHSWKNVRNL